MCGKTHGNISFRWQVHSFVGKLTCLRLFTWLFNTEMKSSKKIICIKAIKLNTNYNITPSRKRKYCDCQFRLADCISTRNSLTVKQKRRGLFGCRQHRLLFNALKYRDFNAEYCTNNSWKSLQFTIDAFWKKQIKNLRVLRVSTGKLLLVSGMSGW